MEREVMETTPAAPPQKSSLVKPVAAVVLLVVLAGGGYAYWNHAAGRESTDDAQIDGRIHSVGARVGGTVIEVLVRDNQFVTAGTVLARIDPKDYEVAVAKAKADLAEAEATMQADRTEVPIMSASSASRLDSAHSAVQESKATLATAEQQVESAQVRVKSAQAMLRQAQANAVRAASDFKRYEALLAKDEISKQQYDAAKSTADATQAQVEAAQAQVHEAEQMVRVAQSQLGEHRAKLARSESDVKAAATAPQQVSATRSRAESSNAKMLQMKAALEQAELNLSYTTVRAPASGIVSQKSLEVGQIITAGQPLMAVVPMDDIWVVANFKENQLAHMKVGQKVEIGVDAYGGRKYQGHVESIAAATGARFSLLPAENSSGNYVKVVQRVPVKILFEKGQDPDHVLRPGMSVIPTVEVR